MSVHNFDIDKHQLDKELRDRVRQIILGIIRIPEIHQREHTRLINLLAHLQPTSAGTNIGRLDVGTSFHWNNRTYSNRPHQTFCVFVLLRQLIINFWDYLLKGSDESLEPDGEIENHLETLEDYIERGLENYVMVGDTRNGYFLMWKEEYRKAMEDVR